MTLKGRLRGSCRRIAVYLEKGPHFSVSTQIEPGKDVIVGTLSRRKLVEPVNTAKFKLGFKELLDEPLPLLCYIFLLFYARGGQQ
jgi:hypothetical protein